MPDRPTMAAGEGLTLLALLALTLAVAAFSAHEVRERRSLAATEAALDEVLGQLQQARHAGRHRPDQPPNVAVLLSDRRDGWGRPLAVDLERELIYSRGADGLDQRGEGDDVVRVFPMR